MFNFLIGDQILLDEVKLKDSNGIEGSFYLPLKKPHNKNSGTNILFPLGKDLRFQQFKLPPTLRYQHIFKAYFSFDQKELEFFKKFIIYKSMSNLEDKFLGYFRILEALTYKRKEILDGDRLKEIAEKAKPAHAG
ncbi:MAG: hypothetical protein D3904_03135 [Candidatus Electrothrix sp. EH2]|nr:hypothetical protein [Candidatus Electrothrix sp. EH2]